MRPIVLTLPAWIILILSVGAQTDPICAATLKNFRASGTAEINGGRLHYEIYGRGAPVVFLHAGIADRRMWDRQVNYLSGKYTVVRFDTRGYGQSDAPIAPYAPSEDLYALLQFLKLSPACIIGSSIGGTQAFDMAAAHPQAVSALVVVGGSPGWIQYSDELNRRTAAITAGAKEKGSASIAESWLKDPMLIVARRQPRVEKEMRLLLSENVRGMVGLSFMRPPDIPVPKLSEWKIPTLVMVGDRDDPEIVERAHLISGRIPGAKEIVIKNADHMVNIEEPREFNRALDRFLQSLK